MYLSYYKLCDSCYYRVWLLINTIFSLSLTSYGRASLKAARGLVACYTLSSSSTTSGLVPAVILSGPSAFAFPLVTICYSTSRRLRTPPPLASAEPAAI